MSAKIPTTRLEQYGVDIVYATSAKRWRRAWRHFGVEPKPTPDSAGRTDSLMHAAGGDLGGIVIWAAPKHRLHRDPAGVIDTLAHESFHAITCVLDSIQEPRDKWHEQPAYLIGWLTAWLWTNTPEGMRK